MELNEKLAKWAGFRHEKAPYWTDMIWYYPEPHQTCMCFSPPDFTTDLNAQVKWLWPELLKRNLYIGIGADKKGWECWIFEGEPIEGDPFQEYKVKVFADTPAMAICKAIETLIEEVSCPKE